MENNQADDTLIEKFLLGQLTEAEATALAERKKDPAFAEQLAFHTDLQAAANRSAKLKLKDRLRQVEKGQRPAKIRQLSWWQKLAIAAGVILVLSLGIRWYGRANYSNQALYAQYYSAPNFTTTRTDDAMQVYAQAAQAYYTEDYQTAIDLLQSQDSLPNGALLAAHAQLQMDRPAAALALVPENNPGTNQLPEWEWVEALAYLASGQKSQLATTLQNITSEAEHPYREEAQALQRQLQSAWRRLTK
ncbi:MAG: hypothetical protein AAF840_04200 [Bacteroidota bacterium]